MGSFEELDIKIDYDSDEDDILHDFFIPLLENSKKYKRLAGFFSSSSLAVASFGIKGLLRNEGTMQLVCGHQLSLKDKEAMEQGLDATDLSENFLKELNELDENNFHKNHAKILGWMIKNKKLEIKIADVVDEPGIFHMKVGIFEDDDENLVAFSGSVNETANAWIHSTEQFDAYKGEKDMDRIESKSKLFDKYWEDRAVQTKVYDLPVAIKNELIKISPTNFEDVDIDYPKKSNAEELVLYDHQIEAIQRWEENNHQGIMAVATGGGKTIIAIKAVELADKSKFVIVIVPKKILQKQWADAIKEIVPNPRIMLVGGISNEKWETTLSGLVQSYRFVDPSKKTKQIDRTFIVATQATASMDKFIQILSNIDPSHVQLVVDEVHNMGSPSGLKIMNIPSKRRMGLSATHIRKFDEDGTEKIEQFFGGVVFEYSIQQAIDDGRLCHYEVHHEDVELTQREYSDYHEHTRTIGKYSAMIEGYRAKRQFSSMSMYEEKRKRELQVRAEIIKSAENKFAAFREIIKRISINEKTIIFCTDTVQLKGCSQILDEFSKSYRIYHSGSELSDNQLKEHIKQFEQGDSDILVGIGCLDEGVDIAGCTTCVLVSSSGTEREYIQRRGRVLRLGDIGKIAHIYDLITYPPSLTDEEMNEQETTVRSILKREMTRTDILIEAADNRTDIENTLQEKFNNFNVNIDNLRDVE